MNELELAYAKVGQLSMGMELAQKNYLALRDSYAGLYAAIKGIQTGTIHPSRLELTDPDTWTLKALPENPTSSLPLETDSPA